MKMCAAPDVINRWEDIDFNLAEKHVKKLQKRIAVAYANDDHDKAECLQHKLIHSFNAKALAVKIVTSNRGKSTPGVDGVIWLSSKDKLEAISKLNRRGYKSLPLRRIYIPKSDGRLRPLSIPTMKDRAMQTLFKFALEPIAEVTADNSSFGYRPKRSAADAIIECNNILSRYPYFQWVLKADIKSCFENISHEWIMSHIPMDKYILRKFLRCGYIDNSVYYPIRSGIPQGGCISSVICNMTLDGLEAELINKFDSSVKLVRYADDIMIVGASQKFLMRCVVPVVDNFLAERGLRLSPEKTKIVQVTDGITFLGAEICKCMQQIISTPSRKSINSLLNKIASIVNKRYDIPSEELCKSLKQTIRGWLSYYRKFSVIQSLYGVEYEAVTLVYKLTGTKAIAHYVSEIFAELNKSIDNS